MAKIRPYNVLNRRPVCHLIFFNKTNTITKIGKNQAPECCPPDFCQFLPPDKKNKTNTITKIGKNQAPECFKTAGNRPPDFCQFLPLAAWFLPIFAIFFETKIGKNQAAKCFKQLSTWPPDFCHFLPVALYIETYKKKWN